MRRLALQIGAAGVGALALPSSRANGRIRAALLSQLPLVTLMVAYTFTGLLVLGLALRGEG